MASKPLLFYDSGAGGLPYLEAARTRLPLEKYVYLADRKNFPLGEKPEELIRRVVIESISMAVRRFDPALIVVACNTASVVALQALREQIPVRFVGVVPAVKPAALSLIHGKLAVVSTRQTATGTYLQRLIREFADGCEVIKVPVANLVEYAEFDYLYASEEQRLAAVRRELGQLLVEKVQGVVLGCTHFLLLERQFQAVLPEGVALIDSREGVTNRIVSLLSAETEGLPRTDPQSLSRRSTDGQSCDTGAADRAYDSNQAELYLHGGAGEEGRYRAFSRYFDLRYCGLLEDK